MHLGQGLVSLLLLLGTASAETIPEPCLCLALQPSGLQVNCSSLGLMEVPSLPADTVELDLHDNHITTVPPGHFDRLSALRRVTLSGNPFHCDCGIQYLRLWLQRNRATESGMPTCASPEAVAHIAIASLRDAYFSSCGQRRCTGGLLTILIGVILCGLIALLLWSLRLAKHSTITLKIDETHAIFESSSLRSLKPKHRRRVPSMLSENSGNTASLTWTDDSEKPLINVELPPQELNIMHTKHNIKIKVP